MWSWGGRSSNGTQLVTMPGYLWGQATTNVNAGTIQALAEGVTWVKMYCPDTNINYTADATVHFLEEGKEYYINNKAYNNANISVETNGSLGTSGDQALLKAFEVATGSQRYTFTMNPLDGYVSIRNVGNGLALGVENNSTSENVLLKQYSLNSSSNDQKFKIVKSGDYVKLLPKTGGDTKGLAGHVEILAPYSIRQKTLNTHDAFLWDIREHVATIRINILLDVGFRNRYSNYQQQVQTLMTPVINTYMNRFDIRVVYDITNYTSYADECPQPYNMYCNCVHNSDCSNSGNMHHKNQDTIFDKMPTAVQTDHVNMLMTGHITCGVDNTNTHQQPGGYEGLSQTFYNRILIYNTGKTPRTLPEIRKTIVHEIGHLYGVEDHYSSSVGGNDSLGRSDNCIWGANKDSYNVYSNIIMCSYCTSVIEEHCGNFNHS